MSKKSSLGLPENITAEEAYIAGVADGEDNILYSPDAETKELKRGRGIETVKKPKKKHYTVTVVGMITIDVETFSVADAYDAVTKILDAQFREIDADFEDFYSHARKADYQEF